MLMNAGGIDVPTNEGLFAPVTTVFREGSLLEPALPGLVDLRQPDVRRGARVDHARARRARCRTASPPAGTSSSAPRSPASTRAPSAVCVALDLHARRAGRDAGAPTASTRSASPARPARCARRTWRCSSSRPRTSSSTYEYLRRLGRRGASGAAATAPDSRWRFDGERRARRRRSATTPRPRAPIRRRGCSAASRRGSTSSSCTSPTAPCATGARRRSCRDPDGHRSAWRETAAAAATATRAGATRELVRRRGARRAALGREGARELRRRGRRRRHGPSTRRDRRPALTTRRRMGGPGMSYRLGIDVGGTFTDFLVLGGDGARSSTRRARRPHDPSLGLRRAGSRRSPGGSSCRSRSSWPRSS